MNNFKNRYFRLYYFITAFSFCTMSYAQEKNDPWLESFLRSKASTLLLNILNHPDSFQYQIIYTEINRDRNNQPHFTHHYFHVDPNRYFNPASTVKLPTALIALEKLNELSSKGIDKYTTMFTDSSFSSQSVVTTDSTSLTGLPSIAQYIKKIFLVSDNDAYNRLYEFDGQKLLNKRIWEKGYTNTRIVRRFVPMTEEENRHTNAIRFIKNDSLIYQQAPAYNTISFDYSKQILVGNGYYNRYDSLIMSPMDFTRHNNLPLQSLQKMLQTVLFPTSVKQSERFHINNEDEQFLLQYLSEYPSETHYPRYDTTEYFNSYTKFFLFKSGKQKIPSHIRIFNKPGWSYGYLTDAAYIVDFNSKTEFMISAVIYVNRDGILNDDKYEYTETGYPFFKEMGEIIYQYDKNRKRKYFPNLDRFKFNYQ